jgi:serine/threonine protein kinase
MNDALPERAEEKAGNLRGVLPAGTMLRGYELKSILGQGAFGITYRARDLTLSRDVAVKEYLPTTLALREGRTTVLPRSPDHAEQFAWGRERFVEEARTLARLDRTPAIVRVHDFLEANGTAYMVMGLVEGETLNKRLMREQRLTPEAVDRLLFPLLDGLEEVHGIGFLHRDIKPANIMVDARGRPTLIDFGAARAAMAGRSTTMTAIFTPGYAAAEQYTSAELGPWTDIYGISATLYHAITGKIPPSAIERIMKDTYQPLSELKPEGYAPELLAGIDAGMARQVEDRPQNIAEWRHVLRTGEHQVSAREVTQIEHKPRRPRRKTGFALRGPALWASAAAAAVLLAGGGYLAFTGSGPTTVGTAALSLSAEQLERALAERRKADTFAAEKRRLEDEARQKAEADAETKRQAESELDQARQARQKAEEELAELKARIAAGHVQAAQQDQAAVAAQRAAEEAAQRKAEADAAALRQAEEEAQKKLEADTEAKRQADEALAKIEAERQKAEQEARQKAEAEQMALRQSSEEAQRKAAEAESVRKAEAVRTKAEADRQKAEAERQKAEAEAKVRVEAEMAEKALRLEPADRQRLQVALTSLGFDTRASDGVFGPRSREMISAWQKARNLPATGFLSAGQQKSLLKEAAPALTKHDEQKKTDEEAKARLAVAVPTSNAAGGSPAPTQPRVAAAPSNATAYDGTYTGDVNIGGISGTASRATMALQVTNGRGAGTLTSPGCSPSQFSLVVSAAGSVSGEGYLNCPLGPYGGVKGTLKIEGDLKGQLVFYTQSSAPFTIQPSRGGAAAATTSTAAPLASLDGLWRGTYACTAVGGGNLPNYTLDLNLTLAKGTSSGGGVLPGPSNDYTLNIEVSVDAPHVTVTRTSSAGGTNPIVMRSSMRGQFDGTSIRASGRQTIHRQASGGLYDCVLTLSRVP